MPTTVMIPANNILFLSFIKLFLLIPLKFAL
jgi:hypothetical protein